MMKKIFLSMFLPKRDDGTYVNCFKMSRYVIFITFLVLLIYITMGLYLIIDSSGSYLAWWIPSFFIVLLFYISISTPIALFINEDIIEIHGAVEVTLIKKKDIKSITPLERQYVQTFYFPIFSSLGFLGHNGYYLDIKEMHIVKMNVTNFNNLILIVDNNKKCFVINDCGKEDSKILKK